MPISGIEAGGGIGPIVVQQQAEKAAAPGFGEYLARILEKANTQMVDAEKTTAAFAAGETNNIHETMLAAEKATIAFKLVGTIRNRMLEAYQEVMRTPL